MSALTDLNEIKYSRKYLQKIISEDFQDTFIPSHQLGPDYELPSESYTSTFPENPVKIRMKESGPASAKPYSLVTFFQQTLSKHADKIAMSVKRGGEWTHWTYEKYWTEVRIVAKAFIKLGLNRFHCVAILGFNAPEWFLSNYAAIIAGGIATGIYATSSSSACEYILRHSRANILVVENKQQLNKILQIKSALPHLKAIIQYTGVSDHEDVLMWGDVMDIGETVPDEVLERRIKNLAVNQCCSITYTSGTTGNPKAVMITHDNHVYNIENLVERILPTKEQRNRYFSLVSYLPLNHLAAQVIDIYSFLYLGGHIYFAQPDAMKGSLIETVREVCPTEFSAVPRIYEKIKEKLERVTANMNWFNRTLINWAMNCCRQYSKNRINKNPTKPYGFSVAQKIVQKILSQIGLHKAVTYGSLGAAIPTEVLEFFYGLNIVILDTYGLSETGPLVNSTMEDYHVNSVGKRNKSSEIKLINTSDDGHGEICINSRSLFMGYMFDEEKTKEAFDEDFWFHTGDIGSFDDDGFLYITGRIKELIITSGGENIAPLIIETAVKAELPIISQAVAIGDRRKFLSMLLTLKTETDLDNLTPLDDLNEVSLSWCKSIGSDAKTVKDILDGPDARVMAAIQKGIDRANDKAVSNACRIQKWIILPKDLTIQDGDLSAMMKLKRFAITEKYKDVIDKFYIN